MWRDNVGLTVECCEWDTVPDTLDVRGMVPWVHRDTQRLIPCEEEDFNRTLAKLGKYGYLGNGTTFQLIHVFALLRRPLSLLILLDRGADITAKTDLGANLLHVAAAGGDVNLVQVLLGRGFDVNAQIDSGRKLTPLMLAARMGHLRVLSALLEKEASVRETDRDGNTALMHAAVRGHLEAVQYFLEKESNPQARNSEGWSALHHAAEGGHTKIVSKLLDNGADINAVDGEGYSSLFRAVVNGHNEAVRILLERGADCNLKSSGGWTALGAAVVERKVELVEIMMGYGLDTTTCVEPGGRTASKLAIDKNIADVQKILAKKKPPGKGKANQLGSYMGDATAQSVKGPSHSEGKRPSYFGRKKP